MKDISEIRREIEETDELMIPLFERRMSLARELAGYKKEHGLPVLDAQAEKEIIRVNTGKIENPKHAPYYVDFIENVMGISNRYQTRINEGMRVAFNGERGAFAHIAAQRIFPAAVHIAYPSFTDAYRAVEKGECDLAVIPVENSYAGEVGAVMDLMFEGELKLTGAYTLPVTHNLLVKSGTALEDIETVISHPQALAQCEKYINAHHWNTAQVSSTSYAARQVAADTDGKTAAIASEEAAGIFGLEILDHGINESAVNTTKFAVFSKADRVMKGDSNGRFIMLFTVSNVAGALAKAINIIGRHGFNMNALRSRPLRQKAWQYYFYAELDGDETSEEGEAMLRELSEQCEFIKIAGHYTAESDLSDKNKYKV